MLLYPLRAELAVKHSLLYARFLSPESLWLKPCKWVSPLRGNRQTDKQATLMEQRCLVTSVKLSYTWGGRHKRVCHCHLTWGEVVRFHLSHQMDINNAMHSVLLSGHTQTNDLGNPYRHEENILKNRQAANSEFNPPLRLQSSQKILWEKTETL